MNIWLDGLSILVDQVWIIACMLLIIIWGQMLITNVFKRILKNHLTNAEYFSLGMSGWLLPVALAALLLFNGTYLFGENTATVVFVISIVTFLFIVLTRRPVPDSLLVHSVLILFLTGSIFLHFVFLRKVILPLYFDSAEHYRIIKYFLKYFSFPDRSFFSALPLTNYYHVGYHFLIASFSSFLKTSIVDAILISGQILVSVLPLPLFFITRRETDSNTAALFTSLLAGFGWHMPGYALNWGKYPALFSLICIQYVLCITYLIFRNNFFKLERPKLFLMLGLGILTSGLIHSRSLIVYVFLFFSMLLFSYWKKMAMFSRHIGFAFVLSVLVVEISFTRTDLVLRPLLNIYIHDDLLITGLTLFLAFFSAQVFEDVTFFCLTMVSLLLAGLFIPVDDIFPNYGNLVLLDRPYLQMLLYLPLSILGGLGLAGVDIFVRRALLNSIFVSRLMPVVMFGCVVLNVFFSYDFYPSNCCQIVNRDDLAAIDWMDKNTLFDADIFIASTDMNVISAGQTDAQAGVDGGAWITPLISRKTIYMPNWFDFGQSKTRDKLCDGNSSYIYVGGEALSFDNALLEEYPAWYQIVLSFPSAKIYKVIGCK